MRGRLSLIAAVVVATALALAACGSAHQTAQTAKTAQAGATCLGTGRHVIDGAVLRIPPGANFLDIHGTADTVVPYNGVPPDRKGSVPRFTARWARRAGCSTTPHASHPQKLVTHLVYAGCDGGRRVEAYRLSGTQHGWPGSTGPFTRRNPSGLKAAPAVLRFIRQAR